MIVWNFVVFAPGLDEVQHGFKLTNNHHVVVNSQEIFPAEVIHLFFNGFVVLVNWNGVKFQHLWFSDFVGIYELNFWHRKLFLLFVINLIIVPGSEFWVPGFEFRVPSFGYSGWTWLISFEFSSLKSL